MQTIKLLLFYIQLLAKIYRNNAILGCWNWPIGGREFQRFIGVYLQVVWVRGAKTRWRRDGQLVSFVRWSRRWSACWGRSQLHYEGHARSRPQTHVNWPRSTNSCHLTYFQRDQVQKMCSDLTSGNNITPSPNMWFHSPNGNVLLFWSLQRGGLVVMTAGAWQKSEVYKTFAWVQTRL